MREEERDVDAAAVRVPRRFEFGFEFAPPRGVPPGFRPVPPTPPRGPAERAVTDHLRVAVELVATGVIGKKGEHLTRVRNTSRAKVWSFGVRVRGWFSPAAAPFLFDFAAR